MNITLINADSIFWLADKNIRLVNFQTIFNQVYNIHKPDQIYLIGGFGDRDPFNENLKAIVQQNEEKPIIEVQSTNKFDGHHVADSILVDLLYRGALSQNTPKSTSFTIVSAECSSINPAQYIAKCGLIEPASFIFADAMDGFDEAAQLVDIKHSIPLLAENRTVLDNLVIEQIMNLIKQSTEKEIPFYNTMSILLKKCKTYFSIPPMDTRLIAVSLIHHGYLSRHNFVDNAGTERVGFALGEKAVDLFDCFAAKKES